MKNQTLTQKQYNFVLKYIENGFNAYQAAIAAGYSHNYSRIKAHLLLNHPSIKERLNDAYKQAQNNLEITFEWKLKKLKRVANLVPDNPNEPVSLHTAKVAIAAIAELNKMQGDYAPDKKLNVTVNATKERLIEARRQYDEY